MAGTFVSIGNSTQDFSRLLDEVKRIASDLPQPVIVQNGRSPFYSDSIAHFDFCDESAFKERLAACSLFITHGGGGSVFSAIRLGRKPVVVPRRKVHNEIVDDHQMAFAEELARQGKIVPVYNVADLANAVAEALANPTLPDDCVTIASAVNHVRQAVQHFAARDNDLVLLVTPSGGHLSEMRNLAPCYANRPHHFVINTPIVQSPEMEGRTTLLTLSQRDWRFVINILEAWQILRRKRPAVILTTGGSIAVPFVLIGKLLGVPTIYVETVAKVNVPTLTGRLVYPFAARFFYQWSYLEKYFKNGDFIGLVL